VGLQSFYCGYSVIIPTLGLWFRWAAESNPGTFAMGAWFQNELKDNAYALGSYYDFTLYAETFGWTTSLTNSVLYLLLIAVVQKSLTILVMSWKVRSSSLKY
jgi:hypothetical protein